MTWTVAQHFPDTRDTLPSNLVFFCLTFTGISSPNVTLPALAQPAQPSGKVALAVARWVSEGKPTASVSITF